MTYLEWVKALSNEKQINKKDLESLLKIFCKKTEGFSDISGYHIKNSIETFLIYLSDILEIDRSSFYFSKGMLHDILSGMGFDIEILTSGAYEKEVFRVKNLDVEFFNRELVNFAIHVAHQHKKLSFKIITPLNKSEKYITLYDVFKSVNKNLDTKFIVLECIFSAMKNLKLIKKLKFKNDKLLFSSYTPSDLYESWYINEIEIEKEMGEELTRVLKNLNFEKMSLV